MHVWEEVEAEVSAVWSPISSQHGEGVTARQHENTEKRKKKDGGEEER